MTTGGAANLSNVSGGDVPGLLRPTIAETPALLVFAGGSDPEKLVKSSGVPSRLGGSPPQGTHIASIAGHLVLNDIATRAQSRWSNVTWSDTDYSGNEDWSTTLGNLCGTFTASGRPDPMVAVGENSGEVFLFGTQSVESWIPDAQAGFVPSAQKPFGCIAPYSVVGVDQNFAWLDQIRRFVVSDGRSESIISDPIQKTLHDMTTVSDCFGYRVVLGTLDLLVWTFPTDGRTFVYQKGAGWAQWSSSGSNFNVTAKTTLRATNDVLVGTSDGDTGTLSMDAPTDFGDPIDSYVITGFQDRGTDAWKSCDRIRVVMRRGATETTDEPYLLISWRDGTGAWETPLQVSLGAAGESNPVVELWSLGVYRRRQWKIDFRSAETLSLVAVTEEFTVL